MCETASLHLKGYMIRMVHMVVPAVCAGLLGMGSNEGQLPAPYGLFKLVPIGLPGAGADFDEGEEDTDRKKQTMLCSHRNRKQKQIMIEIGFHDFSSKSDRTTSPSKYS